MPLKPGRPEPDHATWQWTAAADGSMIVWVDDDHMVREASCNVVDVKDKRLKLTGHLSHIDLELLDEDIDKMLYHCGIKPVGKQALTAASSISHAGSVGEPVDCSCFSYASSSPDERCIS